MEHLHLSVSGIIGAGKTMLATKLAEHLELPIYYEEIKDNKYLDDFYKDMKKYSFTFQIYLLNQRYIQQQQVSWNSLGGVQDRSIYEDPIFAKMLCDEGFIEKRDYETYVSLFNTMLKSTSKPNLIVHLDVSAEESLRRIRLRGRECEAGITLEYLQKLRQYYEDFLQEISKSIRVIKVDWSNFVSIEEVSTSVMKEYESMRSIREINFLSK